jgi:hypothetical protein
MRDVWHYLDPPMRLFDWSKHVPDGFYAKGVLMAMARDVETARSVAHNSAYQVFLQLYRGYTQHQQEKFARESADRLNVILAKEPEVRGGPCGFYQQEVS